VITNVNKVELRFFVRRVKIRQTLYHIITTTQTRLSQSYVVLFGGIDGSRSWNKDIDKYSLLVAK